MQKTLIAFLLVFSLNAFSFHEDSGIKGPSYADMVTNFRSLARRNSDWVTTGTYGFSVANRPLLFVKVAKPAARNFPAPRPVVVMTQVIHGNEYLGIVDKLPAEFLNHKETYPNVVAFIENGGIIYFFPIVNPDGYEADRRTNDNGVDLNRDFDVPRYTERIAQYLKGEIQYTKYEFETLSKYVDSPKLTQPETKKLADVITREIAASNGRLRLSFDYHCCQGDDIGSLMHSWGDTKTLKDGTIPASDIPRYERVGALFKSTFAKHLWGSGYEIINYLTFGTTDEWFYNKYGEQGALSFCYEGQRYSESAKLKLHATLWNRLLGDRALK